jgi:hypothetical protein
MIGKRRGRNRSWPDLSEVGTLTTETLDQDSGCSGHHSHTSLKCCFEWLVSVLCDHGMRRPQLAKWRKSPDVEGGRCCIYQAVTEANKGWSSKSGAHRRVGKEINPHCYQVFHPPPPFCRAITNTFLIPFYLQAVQIHSASRGVHSSTPPYK